MRPKNNYEMTKKEIRIEVKQRVQKMGAADKDVASLYVCLQILGSAEWQGAQKVMLYEALPDEVSLQLLIDDARGSGKTVIIPSSGKDAPIPSDAELNDVDFVIVPGRAFAEVKTPNGKVWNRVGRGGGWYDRVLPKMRCPKWGAAFKCQVFRFVPQEEWDYTIDKVITQ